ncbi:MAG: hypothetical protein HRT69_06255 [Flavobacteriaceae bacterium]|nr:hypothetical protein [Flavobacteriaceae bacterium]
MKLRLLIPLFFMAAIAMQAQVGIGNTSPNAGLDISSTTTGLLIPRVALTSLAVQAPVLNPQGGAIPTSTLIYHDGSNAITAGFYYWDGAQWVLLTTGESSDWTITGNTGTTPATNFIGTIDAVDFITRTNNLERMRVRSDGRVLVNTTVLLAGDNFTARSTIAGDHPINGYSDITGVGIFGSTDPVNSLTFAPSAGSFDSEVRAIFANGGSATAIAIDANSGNPVGAFTSPGAAGIFNSAETGIFAYANNATITRVAGTFLAEPNAANTNRPTANLASSFGSGNDIGGFFSSDNYGVYATTTGTENDPGVYALFAAGDARVTIDLRVDDDVSIGDDLDVFGDTVVEGLNAFGLVTAAVKAFTIDHPTDPTNKILRHYSTESNELTNIYKGNIVFNANGEAIAQLPNYYSKINTNPVYQLTPVGAMMPNLYVKQEMKNNSFVIAGGTPGKKVSWTVLAQRNDKYAQHYKDELVNEIDKNESQKGLYLHPEAWGVSQEKRSNTQLETTKTKEVVQKRGTYYLKKDLVKKKKPAKTK